MGPLCAPLLHIGFSIVGYCSAGSKQLSPFPCTAHYSTIPRACASANFGNFWWEISSVGFEIFPGGFSKFPRWVFKIPQVGFQNSPGGFSKFPPWVLRRFSERGRPHGGGRCKTRPESFSRFRLATWWPRSPMGGRFPIGRLVAALSDSGRVWHRPPPCGRQCGASH